MIGKSTKTMVFCFVSFLIMQESLLTANKKLRIKHLKRSKI